MDNSEQLHSRIPRLWEQLRAATNLEEAFAVTSLVIAIRQSSAAMPEETGDLLLASLDMLKRLTIRDVNAGRESIFQFLLPACLWMPSEPNTLFSYAIHRSRGLLKEWIEQYPEPHRTTLRDEVLNNLCLLIATEPSRQIIGTLSEIGYRSPAAERALWHLVQRDDDIGDAAVSGIVSLGIPLALRPRLLQLIHERAAYRPISSLLFAVQELADPSLIDFILEHADHAHKTDGRDSWFALLAKISEAFPDEAAVQEKAWAAISKLVDCNPQKARQSIYFNNRIVPRCNSPAAVPDFLRWFVDDNQPGDTLRRGRYPAYLRLEECMRPAHIAGWHDKKNGAALPILRTDACASSTAIQESGGPERVIKVGAWRTLFSLGCEDCLSWLSESLAAEKDPFLAAEVLDMAASFAMPKLPEFVRQLIKEKREVKRDERAVDLSLRLAAVRLARSAATRDAFDCLTCFGLLYERDVLLDSSEALSRVAFERNRVGDRDIVDRLFEMASTGCEAHHRTVAISALRDFAVQKILGAAAFPQFAAFAKDPSLPCHVRGWAIEAIGFLDAKEVVEPSLPLLLQLFEGDDKEVQERAVESLVRQGTWSKVSEQITARLHLTEDSNGWRFAAPEQRTPWEAAVIGLLYLTDFTAFAHAAASLIRKADFHAAHEVLRQIKLSTSPLPSEIADALVDRIFFIHTEACAETWIFDSLAQIAPERLAIEAWEEKWTRWLPDARAALGDALGEVRGSASRDRVTTLLLQLLADGIFAVRRSAARSLAGVDARILAATCVAWSESSDLELRKRAAELLGWLEDGATEFHQTFERLSSDPEPTVRHLALRSRVDRVKRRWANDYLCSICSVRGPGNRSVLDAFNHGQGLVKFGEDQHARELASHLGREDLAPHVRFWIEQIIKGIEKRWQKVTREWPEPWLSFDGTIEEIDGVVRVDGRETPVHFSLWKKAPNAPSQIPRWGGACWSQTGELFPWSIDKVLELRVPTRRTAHARITVQTSSGLTVLTGLNLYPESSAHPG